MLGGTLTGKTEDEVLAAIRGLAVREENTMVARVALHNMRQERDEPIRVFGAGQASVCKFQRQCASCDACDADVDYTEAMLRDVLSRGLEDTEIQMDLLGDKNQDMTLEQVLTFVETKEAGKRPTTIATSNGRDDQQEAEETVPPRRTNQEACTYCGTKGHGKNPPTRIRRSECPAFGTHCGKDHHLEKVCRNKNRTDHEDTISDTLCGLTSTDATGNITLDHHIFDPSTDKWYRRPSKPQPYIRLRASIERKDYNHFGYTLRMPPQHTFINAMADTGCQSCLAGLKKLGLSTADLLPVTLKMHAADDRDIPILGAAILRLSGTSSKGEAVSTRQIVYITKHTDKIFLSREACADLGIIPNQFPSVNKTTAGPSQGDSIGAANTTQQDCHCPKRTQPPTTLPYPATEENRAKLEQF